MSTRLRRWRSRLALDAWANHARLAEPGRPRQGRRRQPGEGRVNHMRVADHGALALALLGLPGDPLAIAGVLLGQ